MLVFLIILCLLLAFYMGYRRGFLHELIYIVGYAISFFVAINNCQKFGESLTLWIPYPVADIGQSMALYSSTDLGRAYYTGLAFLLIFIIGWLVTRFIGVMTYRFERLKHHHLLNHVAGGIVNFILMYIFLVCVLTVMSVVPMPQFQEVLINNSYLQHMITETPWISELLQNVWFY